MKCVAFFLVKYGQIYIGMMEFDMELEVCSLSHVRKLSREQTTHFKGEEVAHSDNQVVGPLKWVPLSDDWHARFWEWNPPRNEMVLHPKGIKNKLTWMVELLVMEGQWGPCQQAKDVAHTVNVAHTIAVYGNCLQTCAFYTSRELHIVFHWDFDWVLHYFIHFRCWMDKMISIFC